MKLTLTLLLLTSLFVTGEALAKGRAVGRTSQPRFCNPRGSTCFTYEEIEALRRSINDQDRSSRSRNFYHWR